MCSVETQVGIGMKDLGYGEPLLRDTLEKLPRLSAPLAATSDNAQPALTYLEPKAPEAGEIPGYSMIVEVALYHAPQPSPYLHQRLMRSEERRVGKECRSRWRTGRKRKKARKQS